MRNTRKSALAALTAAALLALAVGGATARNLSVSERNFELVWNNALGGLKSDFAILNSENTPPTCPVTLSGSFTERTIKKETAADQGQITTASVGACNSGSLTVQTESLPWAIRYRGFGGTLPRISSFTVGLIRAVFRTETSGLTCELGTEVNHPGVLIIESFSGGAPENITIEEGNTIPAGGEFLCSFVLSSAIKFRGLGLVRNLAGTAKITLSLI